MAKNLNEYYQSQGQTLPSLSERAKLYESQGLGAASTYVGSANQNNSLLKKLSSGGGVTQTATPQSTVTTPSFNRTTQDNAGFNSVQDLINAGFGGYAGWGESEAIADYKATGGAGKKTGGGSTSLPTQPKINLTEQYNSLIDESGISGLETNVNAIESKINEMTAQAADAKSKVNENPWISEASRIGRIAKIDEKLQNAIAPLQKDVANLTNQINQKKTDVSNKLNLGIQQYNIDVAANQQNLTNFNSLLSTGALANATAQDIATLASQTGLAPSFIQSAIDAAKKAANPLSVGTYTDEGGNLVAYTMDSQGNLINSNKIGKVQATSTGSGSTSTTKTIAADKADFKADASNGKTLRDLYNAYKDTFTAAEILKMYNDVQYYGKATETVQDIISGNFVS